MRQPQFKLYEFVQYNGHRLKVVKRYQDPDDDFYPWYVLHGVTGFVPEGQLSPTSL